MTTEEWATAVIDKVKAELTPIWLGGRQRMLLEQEIAAALDAVRKEAWLAAATVLDEDDILTSPDELDPRCKCQCFGILGRLSNQCRQQAAQGGRG